MNTVDWLLQDDNPGVQMLTRTQILGESATSRKAATIRRACNAYPPAAAMIRKVDMAITAGNYAKYQGAYWTLIFLADMQADARDKQIQRLAKHVLAAQLDNGGFSTSSTPTYEIVCLTANVLRALVHMGFAQDPRVIAGYRRLAQRIVPHGGVPCVVLEYCLHTSCKMTLPQTLRSVAAAAQGPLRGDLTQTVAILVNQLLDVRVFQYVRPDVKQYRDALAGSGAGTSQREFRRQWLQSHRVADRNLSPKPGWKRFGFPRTYNSDLLEAMLSLVESNVAYDPVMEDALAHIESKRGRDGRWRLDDSLNGKMLANIEKKGQPSKWVTWRAMRVLTYYQRLRA